MWFIIKIRTCIHYICSSVLKIGNFYLTLKISMKSSRSQIWNAKVVKAHNGRQDEKMSHDTPQSDGELQP